MAKFIKLTQINEKDEPNTTLVLNIDLITKIEFDLKNKRYQVWALKFGHSGSTITGFEVKETPDEILALIKEAV